MFNITMEKLYKRINDMTSGMNDTNCKYRVFLEESWKNMTSSETPDFEKLGNGHLDVMTSYLAARA
ncbi:hypothetical protein [Oribacterium sp. WCC10]|uniref:hypothetical protein n=1 Tax=Oribacterium sp. WCC10 TaxID=1855343 RepID=UPI0008ED8B2D|nr:hypothetical protein [Oribacterium sp. WCC10]SFG66769.1 hypothetical protein SAMN05216356_1183 [Oribacterium sp. WCC10]